MHFLLDGDPGHDDMLAIFLAAKHVKVVGITTTHGNQSLEKTTLNARKSVELAGLTHIPIAKGLSRPLVNEPRYGPEIHGQSGLDGAELPEPTVELHPLHAVDFIIEMSHKYDDLILVPTGPLTNVAAALIKDPTLVERIKGISWMGGSVTYGNSTAAAEYNAFSDPEAAHVVFTCGVPLKMFGLNVTRMASATVARLDEIRAIGTEFARTIADLIEFYRASLHNVFGLEGASLHDPLAIAIFIKPELFTMRELNVKIELKGEHTRGMTVCDYRHIQGSGADVKGQSGVIRGDAPNCEVAIDLDVDGFFQLLNDTIAMYD